MVLILKCTLCGALELLRYDPRGRNILWKMRTKFAHNRSDNQLDQSVLKEAIEMTQTASICSFAVRVQMND